MDFSEREMKKFALLSGDLLVCEGGEVGRCAVWEGQISPCYYQKALHRVRAKCDDVDNYYFMYYLHNAVKHPRMAKFIGESSIAHFTQEKFITLPLPLPPFGEQKKITEVLVSWDTAIEIARDLIAAKKLRKKGLMQQLLTGKRRLPGYRGKWVKTRLGDLYEEVERPVEWSDDATYSLLSVRRASGGVFLRERLSGKEIKTKVMYTARTGDFLISKMQVLHGATALLSSEFNGMHISGSYIALRPKRNAGINPEFFALLSNTPEFRHLTYLSSYGVHIEKMTFNLDWFMESVVRIPTEMTEQKAIVDLFKCVDQEVKTEEQRLEALQEQKRGLMQKLLTGEVRVKV